MPRLIFKSKYVQSGAGGYVKYIATRDGVVKIKDERLGYVQYMGERRGSHGLFSDSDAPLNLSKIANEVGEHKGNIWTNIVSLSRDDASRLEFDSPERWRSLFRAHAQTFAEQMKIPLADLRWYAAFHDEKHHPHCHLIFYSAGKVPYLSEKGIDGIRSALARDIFKDDLLPIYKQQTEYRNELRRQAKEIVTQIQSSGYDNPVVDELMLKLQEKLKLHKGKKVYGFLSPDNKKLVCEIVDELSQDERLSKLYDLWHEQRKEILASYLDKDVEHVALSENEEFTAIKNAVIEEAQNIVLDHLTFEDTAMDDEAPDISEQPEQESEAFPESDAADEPESVEYYADWTKEYKEARVYLYGNDEVEQDFDTAYDLLQKEAEKGNAFALYDIARMHMDGLGRDKDMDTAQEWFAKAYQAFLVGESKTEKSGYLQFRIGKMNAQGFGVEQNYEEAAEWYEKAVAQDNPFAAYALGGLYYRGQGMEENHARAFDLYMSAAEHYKRPNVFAMYELGKMYRDGIGTEVNKEQSRQWFARAYNSFVSLEQQTKDDKLQYRLGQMCLTGTGTEINLSAANDYFEQSAKLGNKDAMYGLGKLYLSPKFIGQDVQQAIPWLTAAVKEEHEHAQYTLGKLYLKGELVEKNTEYALQLLHQTAEQGNQHSQLLLGRTYLAGKDVPQDLRKAEAMFEAASSQGNTIAQYTLAKMHLNEQAGNSSITYATELLESAAEQNHEHAQYTLGKLFMRGELIAKDMTRAEQLLLSAVKPRKSFDGSGMNSPNQHAAYLLGKLYLSEDGIPKDAEKAVRYLTESSEQENQYAQYQLGKMFLYGKDVEKDTARGITLLTSAAEQGNIYARKVLDSYHQYQGNAKVGTALGSLRLLGRLSQIMKNRLNEETRRDGSNGLIDRKLRREIELKKEAHGQRMG